MRTLLGLGILPLLLASGHLAAQTTPITIEDWGTIIDPDRKCAVVIRDHQVAIELPAGAFDLSVELRRTNAPRILQEVRGDFVLEVQVDGEFQTGEATIEERTAYNGAGLLLWQDDLNYIRLERAALKRAGEVRHYVNFEQRINGRLTRFGTPLDFEVDPAKPCHLRLERKGDQVLGSAKQGDDAWKPLGRKQADLPLDVQVGVAAINASNTEFTPAFEALSLNAANAPKVANQTPQPVKPQPEKPGPAARDRYQVPESASASDLVAFIKTIKETRPKTIEEYRAHATRGPKAMEIAAKRILELEEAPKDARALAQRVLFETQIRSASRMDEAALRSLLGEIREFASTNEAHEENGQLVYSLARSLEYAQQQDLAEEAYLAASKMMKKAGTKPMLRMSEKLAGAARRMKLLGNEMEIRGKLADGKEFSAENYEGKVVLVDFWATWCGPCVAELPNVKKYYELYHDKGFEVVGICLDSSREKLESFVEARKIPWVNLFEDNAAWDHPLATQYGIMAIPTVILIDAEGKVVSLKARGAELGRLLEKELGPVDPDRLKEVEAKLRREMPSSARQTVPPQKALVDGNAGSMSVPLKKLGIALHNHHSAYKQLPPREAVNSQLSWRVQLLPFLGEQALYEKFKLDEPWDSEHNSELIKQIPEVFASAAPELGKEGKTRVVFPFHEKAIYRNQELGSKFRDVLDGLSNTIIVVIADEDRAVTWTKPDDLPIDLEAPKKGWSQGVDGKTPVLIADGRVLDLLLEETPDSTVAALLSRAARERVTIQNRPGRVPENEKYKNAIQGALREFGKRIAEEQLKLRPAKKPDKADP